NPWRYWDNPSNAALTAKDTVSRKPEVRTKPRLASRARTNRFRVEERGFAFQMAFIDDWTSPNTPVAATMNATTPMMEAKIPAERLAALLIISSMALAVASPIRPLN